MNLAINEKLRRFFLGDNTAWDEIADEFYDPMLDWLARRFGNLSFEEVEDVVADWFGDVCIKVAEARKIAEAEGKLKRFSTREIADLTIEYCLERIGFDFAKNFEPWLRFVLKNKVIDYWRKKTRRNYTDIEDENPGDNWKGVSDVELPLLMKEFRRILTPVLGEKEQLYFEIWEKYGWNPSGDLVRAIFTEHFKTDKGTSDASISLIKHRFIRVSYLTFIRIEYDAQLLSETFRRFIGADEDEDTFFDDMMQIIWSVFYEDSVARERSEQKISPALWLRWQELVQKKRMQNRILTEGFRFFRYEKSRPKFCGLVERYAENPFGGKVRDLFFGEDEGSEENE